MTQLTNIINEIHRHKGVLHPDVNDLGWYATQVFSTACEEVGLTFDEYHELIQPFVVNKYKQLLEVTKKLYDQNENRISTFSPDWDKLDEHAHSLVQRYSNGTHNEDE